MIVTELIPFCNILLLCFLLLLLLLFSVVRELTSQALHNLTERDPEYMNGEGEPVTCLASSLGGGCEIVITYVAAS